MQSRMMPQRGNQTRAVSLFQKQPRPLENTQHVLHSMHNRRDVGVGLSISGPGHLYPFSSFFRPLLEKSSSTQQKMGPPDYTPNAATNILKLFSAIAAKRCCIREAQEESETSAMCFRHKLRPFFFWFYRPTCCAHTSRQGAR